MRNIERVLLLGINIAVICYYAFFYQYLFNISADGHRFFEWAILLISVILFLIFLITRVERDLVSGIFDMAIFLCLVELLFSTFYTVSNEYFTAFILLLLVSRMMKGLFNSSDFYIVVATITCVYLVEIFLGLRQIAELPMTITDRSNAIAGTFGNSGIYSICLAIQLPFFSLLVFGGPISNLVPLVYRRIIFFLVLVAVSFIFTYTLSRTAIVCEIVILLLLWIRRYPNLFGGRHKIWIILIGMGSTVFMTFMKWQSAIGRILCWRVCYRHLRDHPWFGTGLGRFTWYYPQWQADYFKNTPTVPRLLWMSSGSTYLAFNEFLQGLLEIGIVPFGGVVLILLFFYNRKTDTSNSFLPYAKITMTGMLLTCLTSYSLHCSLLFYIGFLCVLIGMPPTEMMDVAPGAKRFFTSWRVIFLPLVFYFSLHMASQLEAVQKWTRAMNSFDTRDNVKTVYNDVYPVLKKDGAFLEAYARFLCLDSQDVKVGADCFEEAKRFELSYSLAQSCAESHRDNGNYTQAEAEFRWLIWYVPNRFRPRYELMNMYQYMGAHSKAVQMARVILSLPVKIPSGEVTQFKTDACALLREDSSSDGKQ